MADMHTLFNVPKRCQSADAKRLAHLCAFDDHHRFIGELLHQMRDGITVALLQEALDHWRAAGIHLNAAFASVTPQFSTESQ
jgi:hypothetical protein